MIKEKMSLEKGRRGRTVFIICNTLFLSLLMLIMVIPLWKVIVDSLDSTSVGVRLWPKQISFLCVSDDFNEKNIVSAISGIRIYNGGGYGVRSVADDIGGLCYLAEGNAWKTSADCIYFVHYAV